MGEVSCVPFRWICIKMQINPELTLPFLLTIGIQEGNTAQQPVEVKCEFTVDNEVLSVEYNDIQLEIKSSINCTNSNQVDDNCIKNWAIMKTFSFLYDGYGNDANNFLRIRGETGVQSQTASGLA